MKNRFSSKKIALAGIGAAISLLSVIASFYVRVASLAFNALAVVGMLLPLSQKYYRESILAYVAVCSLGGIFANINILPFVLVGGAYTIATVYMDEKRDKFKPIYAYIVKVAYSCFVFCVFYYLTDILVIDFQKLGVTVEDKALTYVVLNIIFTCLFIAYDAFLLWSYKYYIPLVDKITKNLH